METENIPWVKILAICVGAPIIVAFASQVFGPIADEIIKPVFVPRTELLVECDVDGAVILVDYEMKGVSVAGSVVSVGRFPADDIRLEVKKDGYVDCEEDVSLSGKLVAVTIKLQKVTVETGKPRERNSEGKGYIVVGNHTLEVE